MQSMLSSTVEKAGDAVSGAMSSNKKLADMKRNVVEQSPKQNLTSDAGVKSGNTDIWLSASTEDRQGPQLLEDNFGREKVGT
jgi:catalase